MARQPRRTTMPVAVCRLGLALAIFMLAAASAAHALVCNDLPNVPTLGNDTVVSSGARFGGADWGRSRIS